MKLIGFGVVPNKVDAVPNNGAAEVAAEVVAGVGLVVVPKMGAALAAPKLGAALAEVVGASPKRPAFVDAGAPKKEGVLAVVAG